MMWGKFDVARYYSLKGIQITLLTGLLYYFTARLGYFLTFNHTIILPLWPPAGIGLALMIINGRKYVWPGIAIASVLISTIAHWNQPELSLSIRIFIMAILAGGRVLESIVGYWLIHKFIGYDIFSSPKNTFRFLYITSGISIIGSSILVFCLFSFKLLPIDNLQILLFEYWIGNVVGIFLFAPPILIPFYYRSRFLSRKAINDFIFFSTLVVLVFLLLEVELIRYPLIQALPFISVPYLLWLAFRYGLGISFTGAFVASFIAMYFTVILKTGPFIINQSGENSMLYIQVYIAVITFSTLLMSASVREKNVAQAELSQLNEYLEQRVVERTIELTKRNEELDRFVYSVSHDLRAPVASILGLINLAKTDKGDARENYLEMMYQSAIKQDYFIKEILDHSRNSRFEIQRNEIYFAPLLTDVFQDLQFAGAHVEKSISIKQELPFYSDRWRLKVILSNIISNSIRYRKNDQLMIDVQVIISNKKAVVEVKDNGKGIGKEHIGKLFQMFYRATDDGAGSGLGLYIVKETIDKLKGYINIQSELGKGTVVKFEIPELIG